jgi:hypothetical protein
MKRWRQRLKDGIRNDWIGWIYACDWRSFGKQYIYCFCRFIACRISGVEMIKYAGIGSRKTPTPICLVMERIGYELARSCILRSGRAQGADIAFEVGARKRGGIADLFTADDVVRGSPWYEHASMFHPNWQNCTPLARTLHARNSAIMLGRNLDDPVTFVICWTKTGGAVGGTGQALRIAEAYKIPVFNLRFDPNARQFTEWFSRFEIDA